VHNTPHKQGLVLINETSNNDGVTVGNGQKMKSTGIGQLDGIITDKYRMKQLSVILKDIVYTPEVQFNLLSLTKMMNEGWNV